MALNNYANLKAAIRNRSHRNDMPDSLIDDFIDLGEADIWQRLRVRYMLSRDTASTNSTKYLALPDDFMRMRKLVITIGSQEHLVKYRTLEALQSKSGSGIPTQFNTGAQLEFNLIPTSGTLEMNYYKKLTALSDANTTNLILDNFPQLYFYAALKHLYDWTEEEDLESKYIVKFDKEIKDANKQEKKDGVGPSPAMHIRGTTP